MEEDLDDIYFVQILNDLQDAGEAVENHEEGYIRFLPKVDPFVKLSDTKSRKFFRLDKRTARYLINLLSPHMQDATRKSAMGIKNKVLVALRFFASGSYQEITGSNIIIGISQPSVSRAHHEVCNALTSANIFGRYVKFPQNLEELRRLRQQFFNTYGFPGLVGIIDCTHVSIIALQGVENHPEHIYVNRKGYHSINVQLICDEKLKIINANARYPGSTHYAFIWRQSNISNTLEAIYRNYPNEHFFWTGDSGYPLRPWLLTPIRNTIPGTPEEHFNDRFKSIRSSIERCNGVLKHRFRGLLRHRTLHYKPQIAAKIVLSCRVLHNMCIENNIPQPAEEYPPEAQLGMDIPIQNFHENDGGNRDLDNGRHLQIQIANALFA